MNNQNFVDLVTENDDLRRQRDELLALSYELSGQITQLRAELAVRRRAVSDTDN